MSTELATPPAIGVTWSAAELAELEELKRINESLPEEAPKALLSVRLSILTDDTTSPIRQELDLWRQANTDRARVVGVARDLNVSATKVPPWKRKDLGDWLNNRAPEFDVLYFWKLDRFVRRILDLQVIIEWCVRLEKNLKSLNDPIDLSSQIGKIMVSLIAGMAEIEAANTGVRVSSLWQYAKTQETWLVGAPVYGYKTERRPDNKNTLVHHPERYRVLRYVIDALHRTKPPSVYRLCIVLNRAGVPGPSGGLWHGTSLRVILRNPAITGVRTEMKKDPSKNVRSQIVWGTNGKPLQVGPPIATQEEFDHVQKVLDALAARRVNSRPWTKGSTQFLGVIVCHTCKGNYTKRTNRTKGKTYFYLRCRTCASAGENPEEIYGSLIETVLEELGDHPVEYREYARGEETRKKLREVEAGIAHYMRELAPGGKFAVGGFVQETAEKTLNGLMAEMAAIDPESTKDRWILTHGGKTYRQQWETGGMEEMTKDLVRAGIKFSIRRETVTLPDGEEREETIGELLIPDDVKERLAIREDQFSQASF
jgi:hypothetical protein